MTKKKLDSAKEEISDRVDMKMIEREVLDSEFRKGARIGFLFGFAIFALSLLFGE